MKVYNVEEVFGVSKDQVKSYIERPEVDGSFKEALKTDKQIIIYGSSKQGKTALVSKHLPYNENIVVSCSPRSAITDIYRSILRQLGVEIITERQAIEECECSGGLGAKFKAYFGETSGNIGLRKNETDSVRAETMEFNLELPQDIFELYRKTETKKTIILENFHYLQESVQGKLAFDLRTFQELGMRFVILGVWKEKNHLVQYNGDLLDRITEIPVEPWDEKEFVDVVREGEKYLNINISTNIVNEIIENSFGSIGVIQELVKTFCIENNILKTQKSLVLLSDKGKFELALLDKVNDYATRHIRALEDIAKGQKVGKNKEDALLPLYLPYYFVRAILTIDFDEVFRGVERRDLEEEIKRAHHRSGDVRPSDISNLLYNLTKMQVDKSISPPIFDYDRVQRTVKVIDSTFYFFLKNVDSTDVLANIPNPLN